MANRLPHLQRPTYAAQHQIPASNPPPMPLPGPIPGRQTNYPPREPRIQSQTLPHPIQDRYDSHIGQFVTQGQLPPPALAQYTAVQQGISNPRTLRFSCVQIAIDSSIQKEIGLPIAAIWQPLAQQQPEQHPYPFIVNPPFRCSRCSAYVNPHFRLVEGGQKIMCNICELVQDCPVDFIRDRLKPQLSQGTYEFLAPPEYSNRKLNSPLFLFAIECSGNTINSGLVQQVISSIQNILDYIPAGQNTRIGIMTYDQALTFYKVNSYGEFTQILVNDISDPFVPESIETLTFNVVEQREQLDLFLDRLRVWNFNLPSKPVVSVGCVIDAVKNYLLKSLGGRLMIFSTQMGSQGKLPLQNRFNPKMANSQKEKEAIMPTPQYLQLGQQCTSEDVCVDLFVFTNNQVDAASQAAMCSQTGGDFYLYPNFDINLDGEKLYYTLFRILTRNQGTQVVMRARVSNGLTIQDYIGKFKRRGPIEMEAAAIDADKSILVVLKHDEKLTEDKQYFLQCAMLYTNMQKERVIRVSNGVMRTTRNIGGIFKGSDLDAIANTLLKQAAINIYEHPIREIRDNWHQTLINILYTHRKSIQQNTDLSKILLPDSLKLLPAFSNASLKLPAFTMGNTNIDNKMYSIHTLLSMPLFQSRLLIYPLVFCISDIEYQVHQPGFISSTNTVTLPTVLPASGEHISNSGVYLIWNGEAIFVFVGPEVPDAVVQQIWGIDNLQDFVQMNEYHDFQDIGTEVSNRVLAIVEELKRRTPGVYPLCYFIFQRGELLRRLMVEDSFQTEKSYGDYLLLLHRTVLSKNAN